MPTAPVTSVNTVHSPYSTQSDAELVLLSLEKKDSKAFRELVNRYGQLIYNYAHRMAQKPEQSEEITQDVFMKVYKNLDKYDTQRPFKPWLMRIASNTAISAIRKQRSVISITELEESGTTLADTEQNEPEFTAELRLNTEELLTLMQQLDPKYRHALILRYCQDMPYEEIADSMDVPINTIRTWLKRGKEKLITLVQQEQTL